MSMPTANRTPDAEMWMTYQFRGYRVMVIQQWSDPFGRKMARAEGMLEEVFMQEAMRER